MTRKRAGQWMSVEEYRAAETEAQFQQWVEQTAREYSWVTYHTRFSLLSAAGFPDVVLVKAGYPVIYAELKRMGKEPTARQAAWLDLLRSAQGTRVHVWKPDDREKIVAILSAKPEEAW